MKAVHLAPGDEFEEPLDLGGRIELPRHVEMGAAPAERGLVLDAPPRREGQPVWVLRRTTQDLAEGDEAIEHAGPRGGGDQNAGL